MPKIHLDPRTKLLLLLIVVIFTIFSPTLWEEIIMIALIAFLALLHGEYKKSFLFLLTYATIRLILYLCGYIPHIAGGVLIIIFSALGKTIPTLMFSSCILLNTKISSLITGMQKMGISQKITITLAAALRFIPTAFEERRNIKDAMILRGIQINFKNLITRPSLVFDGAIIPLMLRSAIIAEELAASSITRGLDSARKRTSVESLYFKTKDFACILLFLVPIAIHLFEGALI